MRRVLPSAIAVLLLACSAATIISFIDAGLQILAEVNAYVGVIPPAALQFFTAGADCIAFASTEVASSDPAGVQRQKIIDQCGAIVKQDVSSFPPALVNLAVSLIDKINSIIFKLPNPPPTARAAPIKLSSEERTHLVQSAERARTLKAQMLARKK